MSEPVDDAAVHTRLVAGFLAHLIPEGEYLAAIRELEARVGREKYRAIHASSLRDLGASYWHELAAREREALSTHSERTA